jgi:hypothetical protein
VIYKVADGSVSRGAESIQFIVGFRCGIRELTTSKPHCIIKNNEDRLGGVGVMGVKLSVRDQ